jgi:hypothetical protein
MGIFSQLSEEDQKRQHAKKTPPTQYPQPAPERANARIPERENGRVTQRVARHASERGNVKRASFEVYPDQLKALKQLSVEEQLNGESGSMSAMVREALDKYILERKRRNRRIAE